MRVFVNEDICPPPKQNPTPSPHTSSQGGLKWLHNSFCSPEQRELQWPLLYWGPHTTED